MKIPFVTMFAAFFPYNGGAVDVTELKSIEELEEVIDVLLDDVNLSTTIITEKTLADIEDIEKENDEDIMLGDAFMLLDCDDLKSDGIYITVDEQSDKQRRNLGACNQSPSNGMKNAVSLGGSALDLLDGLIETVPLGFGFAVVKSIFHLTCDHGGDTGLLMNADKVAMIATESAKEQVHQLIMTRMQITSGYIQEDKEYSPYGKIPAYKALTYAGEYMDIATLAGSLGIGGYETAVAAISHSLALYSLVKDAAYTAGITHCSSHIGEHVSKNRIKILEIESATQDDFEDLRSVMKGTNMYSRFVTNWFNCWLFPMHEMEAYAEDRSGQKIQETAARYHNDATCYCPTNSCINDRAILRAVPKVDDWVETKKNKLLSPYNDFFKAVERQTPLENHFRFRKRDPTGKMHSYVFALGGQSCPEGYSILTNISACRELLGIDKFRGAAGRECYDTWPKYGCFYYEPDKKVRFSTCLSKESGDWVSTIRIVCIIANYV